VAKYGTSGADRETFQIILNADGSIVTQYKSLSNMTSCTVGIENATGTDGLNVVFNAAYLHDTLAVRFDTVPPVSWLTVAPEAGTVPPSGNDILTASFDATGLTNGVYQAIVRISSNDADEPVVDIPATLTVADATDVVATIGLPVAFELAAPQPNPFGSATSIRYAIPEGGAKVSLAVFDVAGRHVRTLVNGERPAGRHVATWDGRDAAGRRVVSGIYFYKMESKDFSQVRKVTLLK
jgi:hypothetical protein